ncbi:MAG: DUF4102 domain-containing protein [Geobacter sp.]|nr:DUF4102 domain-containing protein [Geobacter sp.]
MSKTSVTKFTDSFIKGLKPAAKKFYVRAELQGLAVCVYPTGLKSWFFIFTYEGKRYSMALGNYPDVSLGKVKELYADAWKIYASGGNPALKAKTDEYEKRFAPTVSMLVDEYIASLTKSSKDQDAWALRKYVVPALGQLKVADVRRRDIYSLLSDIMNNNGGGMSNQVRKYLSSMFNFALEHEVIDVSPVSAVKKLAKSKPRERYLKAAEIVKVWHALDSGNLMISDTMVRALKLILVTGQRPGDIAGMHLSEINGDTWTIPAGRYKTDIDHVVYLTPFARSLFPERKKGGGFVFPSPHAPRYDNPMLVNSMAHAVRRNRDALGIAAFTPHDLRRTAASNLGRLKFSDEVIDAVLGHIKTGIIRTYNQHTYEEEKKAALIAWSDDLERMINAGKGKGTGFKGYEWPAELEHDPFDPADAGII